MYLAQKNCQFLPTGESGAAHDLSHLKCGALVVENAIHYHLIRVQLEHFDQTGKQQDLHALKRVQLQQIQKQYYAEHYQMEASQFLHPLELAVQ